MLDLASAIIPRFRSESRACPRSGRGAWCGDTHDVTLRHILSLQFRSSMSPLEGREFHALCSTVALSLHPKLALQIRG